MYMPIMVVEKTTIIHSSLTKRARYDDIMPHIQVERRNSAPLVPWGNLNGNLTKRRRLVVELLCLINLS